MPRVFSLGCESHPLRNAQAFARQMRQRQAMGVPTSELLLPQVHKAGKGTGTGPDRVGEQEAVKA